MRCEERVSVVYSAFVDGPAGRRCCRVLSELKLRRRRSFNLCGRIAGEPEALSSCTLVVYYASRLAQSVALIRSLTFTGHRSSPSACGSAIIHSDELLEGGRDNVTASFVWDRSPLYSIAMRAMPDISFPLIASTLAGYPDQARSSAAFVWRVRDRDRRIDDIAGREGRMATGGRPVACCCAAVLLATALLLSAPDATGSARSLPSLPSSPFIARHAGGGSDGSHHSITGGGARATARWPLRSLPVWFVRGNATHLGGHGQRRKSCGRWLEHRLPNRATLPTAARKTPRGPVRLR
ncbi:hypothetical protein HU200_004389 [Digitaria exilis]|uniref:Uncharacterized protein n=1 Tax=Digitaria exilis TaxID=1010633 RepID=A0A835FVX0_9POAL|nr:hypothetical protein HU200_004389 [Digitaria exilis]